MWQYNIIYKLLNSGTGATSETDVRRRRRHRRA